MLLLILGIIILMGSLALANDKIPAVNQSCLSCHQREGFSIKNNGKEISLTVNPSVLTESVHKNNPCTTCHMGINGFPHQNVVYGSKLSTKVNKNCQMCHSNVATKYRKGSHWQATKEGETNVNCSNCHGEHDIQKLELTKHEEVELCTNCHQGEVLESYEESFHGKAVKLGSEEAASCIDCHGAHQVLGPDAKNSMVSKENVPETCAQCHNEPRANFAKGSEHVAMKAEGDGAPMYYTLKFFTWLTILTVSFLVIHIVIELVGKFRRIDQDVH